MEAAGGRYRIQAVSEMTGVPAATLRAWERRYGVPTPGRTSSSYRLYSDRDVELVRNLRDLVARGVAPAEAAKLLAANELPEVGADGDADGDAFAATRARLLEAIARFDAAELDAAARSAMVLGSAATLLDKVIVPTLHEVGERWHRGELSIAAEHLASETLGGVVRELLRLVQPSSSQRMALLACLPDEIHVLPLQVAAFRFAQWGFRSLLLGARTPVEELAGAFRETNPTVVALSATIDIGAERLGALLGRYAAICGDVPWVLGGQGTTAHGELIASHGALLAGADPSALHRELTAKLGKGRRGRAA